MTEDHDGKDSPCDSSSKSFINKSKEKKPRLQKPLTKIILRRLPPTMTEESFLEQVSPIPDHDYFYFARPDLSLGNNVYSRAYINFLDVEDMYLFRDKFDGYVFLDEKGVEYMGIVEYAPFQRIPKKKKKKDPKCGTIESDPVFQEFIESLSKDQETENQPKLEYSYPINMDGNDKKMQSTPLLEYLAARKLDKRGRDERRRRENDKRKMRIERKIKEAPIKEDDAEDNDVKKIKPRDWDREKSSTKFKDDAKSDKEESKSYKEHRKTSNAVFDRKKRDDTAEEGNKRDADKETAREQKNKKYTDTRKERIKSEAAKSEKSSKADKPESKSKLPNHNDIKPFTQLPQVKTDDLVKIIDGMDRKVKLDETQKSKKENVNEKKPAGPFSSIRRNSMDTSENNLKEESQLKREKSLDDRCKSSDREGSEENEKSESSENRSDRRIRNKDRPTLAIYQPRMGRLSKQRPAKDKETEKKDT